MAYNSKKTLRELIERAIYALNITDDDEKNFAFVTKKAKNDVVTDVWRAVNSASREIKQSFIDNLADQVLDNTI
ncbi:MAG: hypothetical protein J6D23_01205 [Clostridia bacterium]|nr:hypothetical protein [Clostridia bacterium]